MTSDRPLVDAQSLTEHGVLVRLVRAPSADGESYELARRDWSNASDPASG